MAVAKQNSDSTIETPDENTLVVPPELEAPVVVPEPPTLDDAFTVLCQAMVARLDDNLPAQVHAQEVQAWFANGPANHRAAWQHAVWLLEQVLGYALVVK